MSPRGLEPIDLRWSFDRLAGLVVERIERDPRSRTLFVFFGKRHAAVKVLFFDGTGLRLFYKRLDPGTFRVPEPRGNAATLQLSEAEFDELVSGLEAVVTAKIVKLGVHRDVAGPLRIARRRARARARAIDGVDARAIAHRHPRSRAERRACRAGHAA